METEITVDTNPAELPPSMAQPQATSDLVAMEAQIKAASDAAQARGEDPSKLPIGVLAGEVPNVPKKFVQPTGEVDVEKLKASTERLNEEIQKKEEVRKSVDDYLQAEKKFRNLPNVEKLTQKAPAAPQPVIQEAPMTREQIEARINADIQANPAATVANLIDIMFEQKFGNLGFWTSTDDSAKWTFELPKSGDWIVEFDYACEDSTAGSLLRLSTGGRMLTARVPGSGTWETISISRGKDHM